MFVFFLAVPAVFDCIELLVDLGQLAPGFGVLPRVPGVIGLVLDLLQGVISIPLDCELLIQTITGDQIA
jgi:hypothetical protein